MFSKIVSIITGIAVTLTILPTALAFAADNVAGQTIVSASSLKTSPSPSPTPAVGDGAAKTAPKLEFKEYGNGKFIYCNNNELIKRWHLADTSNPNPTFIMSSENMKPDQYTLLFSHINRTETSEHETQDMETDNSKIKEYDSSEILETGFDIEVDVQFKALRDTQIKFKALGFEAQQPKNYYYMSKLINYEDSWGCMNALSSYFNMPIYEQGDVLKYNPVRFQPITSVLKAGDTLWLSKYIPNYQAVSWMKPVHLICDFEIISGECDINVAAVKSNGTLRDRSSVAKNPADGRYYYDRQYKGVAQTLPQVDANLSYTIDDGVTDGTYLPVTVENRFTEGENVVNTWVTHLNAFDANKYIRKICVNSDLIEFTYKDDTKPDCYGPLAVKNPEDTVWIFDTLHSDLRNYSSSQSVYSPSAFVPNYLLDPNRSSATVGCNLANYCVKERYNLTVTNNGGKTRYFKYNLATTANALVNVLDENGKYINPYLIAKGSDDSNSNEAMAFVELPPNVASKFTIEVFLPINYPGGLSNQFQIVSEKSDFDFPQDMKQGNVKDMNFTGKEYFKFENGELYTSADGLNWSHKQLDKYSRSIFEGNYNNFEIVHTNIGNLMRYKDFVETPSYYSGELKYRNKIYFLNEDYNIVTSAEFDEFPHEISWADGEVYVNAGNIYSTADGRNFRLREDLNGFELPKENSNGLIATMKEKDVYVGAKSSELMPVKYLEGAARPRYIEQMGGIFYYAEGNSLYISVNGYEFTKLADTINKIQKLSVSGNQFIINDSERIDVPELESEIQVAVNNELLQFSAKPILINDRTLVPLRGIFEAIDADVTWDNAARKAIVKMEDKTIEFGLNDSIAKINGVSIDMGAAAIEKSSVIMVPLRFLGENLGFRVEWIQSANMVKLTYRLFT